MKANIVTVGDEILIGQIVDTNSAWLADFLEKNGIQVNQITSVSDSENHIKEAIQSFIENGDLDFIFITGGLGPTKDDLTKKTLCDFFNDELVLNHHVLEHIRNFFKSRGRKVNFLTEAQAMVPSKCNIIHNEIGTAPALWFEYQNKVIVAMPGVPYEMKNIMKSVILKVKKHSVLKEIIHKTIYLRGIVESHLAEMISDWENNLPKEIKLAYLPSKNCLKLRFSARGYDREFLQKIIDTSILSLKSIVGVYFSDYQTNLSHAMLTMLLRNHNKTISTAESCTGGNLARLISSISKSSECFAGSVVAYSKESKVNILGVNSSLIEKYGLVSEEVVAEMALCSINLFDTDYAIATSGIAGPDGGSEDLPVGTICYAIASKQNVYTFKKHYKGDRNSNVSRVSDDCINFLISEIENKLNLG